MKKFALTLTVVGIVLGIGCSANTGNDSRILQAKKEHAGLTVNTDAAQKAKLWRRVIWFRPLQR